MIKPTRQKPPQKRREQQRAADTKTAILAAALEEFADKGFDAASIRVIAERTGLNHPLITYHYKTKDILWRAVAEEMFAKVRLLWDEVAPADSTQTSIERVREEYRIFMRFTMEYPDFHRFMVHESRSGSPRLAWVVETILKPLMTGILPYIADAQAKGELPPGHPVLVHYMFIGMISVLSSLAPEIQGTSQIDPKAPQTIEAYWTLIETAMFNKKPLRP